MATNKAPKFKIPTQAQMIDAAIAVNSIQLKNINRELHSRDLLPIDEETKHKAGLFNHVKLSKVRDEYGEKGIKQPQSAATRFLVKHFQPIKRKIKNPTIAQIKDAMTHTGSTKVPILNAHLKQMALAPISAKKRDIVVKTVEKNHPPKPKPRKKAPGRGGRRDNAGGARAGSGRKMGAATKKTRKIANDVMSDGGLTPLQYMIDTLRETPEAIRKLHKDGKIDSTELALRLGLLMKRRDDAAKDAAPYVHPRLTSIEAKIDVPGHEVWLARLAEEGL